MVLTVSGSTDKEALQTVARALIRRGSPQLCRIPRPGLFIRHVYEEIAPYEGHGRADRWYAKVLS